MTRRLSVVTCGTIKSTQAAGTWCALFAPVVDPAPLSSSCLSPLEAQSIHRRDTVCVSLFCSGVLLCLCHVLLLRCRRVYKWRIWVYK